MISNVARPEILQVSSSASRDASGMVQGFDLSLSTIERSKPRKTVSLVPEWSWRAASACSFLGLTCRCERIAAWQTVETPLPPFRPTNQVSAPQTAQAAEAGISKIFTRIPGFEGQPYQSCASDCVVHIGAHPTRRPALFLSPFPLLHVPEGARIATLILGSLHGADAVSCRFAV
ncbi:uncharacterized protein EI97DRAFT_63297 [Westerdykella ornata]|uniref:Uncharacterized protein n=1 Tax=Westerdykella ornata TaxID=318751 RepID=A0A6A6JIE1_WESOR|nr:uncharacterized protein EI97DRAFT_63297 [Westerdykella ornata]KAF2276005.1 hypothetical protein EI97DRAFT_63297 [Westerdykella ornata]